MIIHEGYSGHDSVVTGQIVFDSQLARFFRNSLKHLVLVDEKHRFFWLYLQFLTKLVYGNSLKRVIYQNWYSFIFQYLLLQMLKGRSELERFYALSRFMLS